MPEKNEQLVKDWQVEVKELESELEKANTLLKSKMDQVNKETNVSLLYIIIHYVFNEFLTLLKDEAHSSFISMLIAFIIILIIGLGMLLWSLKC